MPGIVVASPSSAWVDRLARDAALPDVVRRHWRDGLVRESLAGVVGELLRDDPEVVVVGPDLPPGAVLALASALDDARPDVAIVVVAPPSTDLLARAMRAGARDVVAPDASPHDVWAAIGSAREAARRRRAGGVGTARARVIGVVAPKGGVGRTVIATNLALGLARCAPGEVVIADLDLQFGDVAGAYRVDPERSIADVARLDALDRTTLELLLAPHGDLFVLPAPRVPAAADTVTPGHVERVVDLLAAAFAWVVVDTAAGIDEATLAALPRCTDLVLVTSTDAPSARATRIEVETLDRLGIAATRHLVLNRADAPVGLGGGEVAAAVGLPVDVPVPAARSVPVSLNQGVPVLESDPTSPVARALDALTARFVSGDRPADATSVAGRQRRAGR